MGSIFPKHCSEILTKQLPKVLTANIVSELELRHRVCFALVEEIETWIAKTKTKKEKKSILLLPRRAAARGAS